MEIGIAEITFGAVRGERAKGARLQRGGTVAVPSPASPAFDTDALAAAVGWLESEGYDVVFTRYSAHGRSFAARSPVERARDLEVAFAEPGVDAILCIGDDHAAAQLLRQLDFELIAENPKPFVGFGETTVLHTAIGQQAELVTFWGPLLGQLGVATSFTREGLLQALTTAAPIGIVDADGPPARTITGGFAEGQLVGGTTSRLCTLMGTPWELDTRGKILLLEDFGEDPCRVGRYVIHLLNAGKLDGCAGIVLAEHVGCVPHPERPVFHGPQELVEDLLEKLIAPLGIPAVHGLPLGHGGRFATVPLGVKARLDAGAGRLELLEGGVY